MSENLTTHIGRKRITVGKQINACWILGYDDVKYFRPWSTDYENWPPSEQKHYENGRLIAINIRTSGQKIPPLRVKKTPAYKSAYETANANIGVAHEVKLRLTPT